MEQKQRFGGLDRFKFIAAFLVVAIYTSPLSSFSANADFLLTRVLARTAVPFFLMVTGYFLLPQYDLLKKKPFQTIQVDNRTRIDRISFWAWYESQDFYRTVADQQADRLKFGETLTMPEVARLLGTHRNNVYCFETIQTSRTKLICKDSFERWYEGQSKYRIVSAANGGDEDGIHC